MKIKRNKKKKLFVIMFVLLLVSLIWIVPTKIIKSSNIELVKRANININDSNSLLQYNILDLIKLLSTDNTYIVETNLNSEISYNNVVQLTTKIENFDNTSNYEMIVYLNDTEILNKELKNNIEENDVTLTNEGKNIINITIKKDNNEEYKEMKNVYYIIPYEHQFLEDFSQVGVSTHYGLNSSSKDKVELSIELLKSLGTQIIRDSIRWDKVYNNSFNFEETDEWIEKIHENDIELLAVLAGGTTKQLGDDWQISNDEELSEFKEYINQVAERYKFIKEYEILNEPNSFMTTNEQRIWYSRIINITNEILKENNSKIIAGSTMVPYKNEEESIKWIQDISRFELSYKNINAYSYHPYASVNDLEEINLNYRIGINELGGFSKKYVTEFGKKTSDENDCSDITIQQCVINQSNGVDISILYQFRTINSNNNYDYGLLNYDYTPKTAYYAMKNFFTNTNGAEYIGTVNLADGLEAHVYDKDGKPKIITWSTSEENTIELPYKNFTASDIYGNEIENTDGTLEITTSPVYLDNISDAYFYEAISNTALEKYAEFEEKFEAEIASINGLQEEINTLKQYMSSIATNTTEDENIAIEQMNNHFNLGNVILSAYKNGSLDVEYVKLSSMLDMLNDIGNSYEDLLTVCATTRAPYYTATEELINSAENRINNNSDLEIVYPSKILDFAKELDEKSKYINSLSEENDIKTGLIVSNSLHAYYLADWANEFASIYIDEYIEANPVTVSYSNSTEWTNEDVVATLNIGNDATVTNNGGSNTYTFRSNGSFTFEYERRGQAFSLEARVSNIDKTYPTITGVKDGQTYTSSVKPVVEDTNLSIVSISYNGENIEYYDGITLEDEGMYSIIATDRAGNTTTVEFNIISEVQDNYIIKDNYLLNVWQETTLTDFKNNYTSQEESYIIKRNDKELTDTDIVATGDIIELSSGDTYTIIVAGDINCDGKVTVFDLSALRRYILKQIEFTEIELLSADINLDYKQVGVMDYSRMRIEILSK